MIKTLLPKLDADPEDILEIAVVGNPVMLHLFLGLDPRGTGARLWGCLETQLRCEGEAWESPCILRGGSYYYRRLPVFGLGHCCLSFGY